MPGVRITPFTTRSVLIVPPVVSRPYTFEEGVWTEVENYKDLNYILSNDHCIFVEQPPLGNQCVVCNSEKDSTFVRVDDAATGCERREEYQRGEVYCLPPHMYRLVMRRNDFAPISLIQSLRQKPDARVLITRGLGLGDILLSLPAVRTLKEQFPDVEIWYRCQEEYKRIFWNNPFVTKTVDLGEAYDYAPFDLLLDWQYAVESHPEQAKVLRTDLFADIMGLKVVSSYEMPLEVKPEEREKMLGMLPEQRGPLVAIHTEGANFRRMISAGKVGKIMQALVKQGLTPMCLHHTYNAHWDMEGVVNLTGKTLPIGRLFAAIDIADVVLCGDSGPTHVANALGKPTVALYGHVDAKLRVKDQPNCVVIQGNKYANCSPCNDHESKQCAAPAQCIEKIPNELIVDTIMGLVGQI